MNSEHDKRYCIEVTATTKYLADQSDPEQDRYVFSYNITITNHGTQAAQLISRHWVITDAKEQVQEVYGEGVVGNQPVIQPGESYTYSSGTMLNTQVGSMQGSYAMLSDDGHEFETVIPAFTLAQPNILN